MKRNSSFIKYFAIAALSVIFLTPATAFAHCDTMDGPVVKAAQKALKTRNVNYVLIWVQKQDEAEIKEAFRQVLNVRKLNQPARELADKYFFETLVRVHRIGEGETFTGLKPAGTKIAPIIAVLDATIKTSSIGSLLNRFPAKVRDDIQERFKQVIARKKYNVNDVEAGRKYVKTYVTFIHYVEHLYEELEKEG